MHKTCIYLIFSSSTLKSNNTTIKPSSLTAWLAVVMNMEAMSLAIVRLTLTLLLLGSVSQLAYSNLLSEFYTEPLEFNGITKETAFLGKTASPYDDSSKTRRNLRTVGLSLKHDDPMSQLHHCRDSGEAYAAAYLIHKEHLMNQFTDYNLTWVNCEMGSFIMMNRDPDRNSLKGKHNRDGNATLAMSIDVLDYSVVHLSTFERLQRRWVKMARGQKHDFQAIMDSVEILKSRAMFLKELNISHELHEEFSRTVVVMPFLGSDMGAGHSQLGNRLAYLSACFWSFYAVYPHIVAMVKSPKDAMFARNTSGLPFYDVVMMPGLPKSASLPVSTVQETKRRMSPGGEWEHQFDYMFFTESDQLLMMRIPETVYAYVNSHHRHLMIPHRLMAYPPEVVVSTHGRNLSTAKPYDWVDMSCCLPRQECRERKTWESIKNASAVPILSIYGIQVPLGNSNFHAESYRFCKLTEGNSRFNCP